ncbi:uncharacterized protein MELLADRAFT_93405 [Melampsora larici-populina 98AG31]|uniref:malate dehydrogenase n=1 Tax=Melampsora larici-populina (strain 98AG31 / pathotype 3-4-7) TaxID=747676 RepID=F4RA98_MELLP|nr:uncharacterized protein MELLADRAFT_93405 [Melampsora larici-populina 98AG31]EGG10441.1 hypothetical protein MELLADRAFT_93405 [Melampsora larici-populina 98AG31]
MKQSSLVSDLALYDVRGAPGVAAKALDGAGIVLIPAGVPRKPGMTQDDLFNVSISLEYVFDHSVINL